MMSRRRTEDGRAKEDRRRLAQPWKNTYFKDTRSLPNEIEKRFEVLHGFLKDHETEYVLVMTPLLMLEIYTFQLLPTRKILNLREERQTKVQWYHFCFYMVIVIAIKK